MIHQSLKYLKLIEREKHSHLDRGGRSQGWKFSVGAWLMVGKWAFGNLDDPRELLPRTLFILKSWVMFKVM